MHNSAPWIVSRPAIKTLDCTIRDGGLINNHKFTDEFVRAAYNACIAAGVDYMEMGYKGSAKQFSRKDYGAMRFCEEEDLIRIIGKHDTEATGLKLVAMADAGKSEWQKFVPKKDSALSMIRVAFYAHQLTEALEMIQHVHDLGYETSANLMSVSVLSNAEIDTVLEAVAQSQAGTMVIVDSFGHLYREQIDQLYTRFAAALKGTNKEIGIHAHNNLQLAFSNTIDAIIHGANRVDATMGGLGRGAGNCPMEILLSFLRNPKYKLLPVIEMLQHHIEPLRETLDWGPSIPYIITGSMNRHPKVAMDFLVSPDKKNLIGFYEKNVTLE
ncbi:MAG: aldolase catalytic domain-containing protein [Verrucomicrobiota bacterium]|nr:aldolase catalytic domain-containing protein [Verrucomicrobiota bacterium]